MLSYNQIWFCEDNATASMVSGVVCKLKSIFLFHLVDYQEG